MKPCVVNLFVGNGDRLGGYFGPRDMEQPKDCEQDEDNYIADFLNIYYLGTSRSDCSPKAKSHALGHPLQATLILLHNREVRNVDA
jgi:hypothetical protein